MGSPHTVKQRAMYYEGLACLWSQLWRLNSAICYLQAGGPGKQVAKF